MPIVTILIAFTSASLFYALGAIPVQLIWHSGEHQIAWQWLTAHFSHISDKHLMWNLCALLILGTVIEDTSRRLLLTALISGIVGVNLYLAAFYNLAAYAGLSGTLNSLLVIALYCLYQNPDYRLACLITLVLSILKIVIESTIDMSLFSDIPWPSVPLAHLAGMTSGIILLIIFEYKKRFLGPKSAIT